jgi:hypothetical protein
VHRENLEKFSRQINIFRGNYGAVAAKNPADSDSQACVRQDRDREKLLIVKDN